MFFAMANTPAFACLPDDIDGWESWCEENGVDYSDYDNLQDFFNSADQGVVDDFWNCYSNTYVDGTGSTTITHDEDGNMTGNIDEVTVYGHSTTTSDNNTDDNTDNGLTSDPDPDPDPNYDNDNNHTYDCAGTEDGNAYTDKCGECVGGDTGQDDCEVCSEMESELLVIMNGYQNNNTNTSSSIISSVRYQANSSTNDRCAPVGYIYRNGSSIAWSSIETSSMEYVSVSKCEYNHFDGVQMLINRRDLYDKASNYGASALSIPLINLGTSKIAEYLSKNLTKLISKGCSAGIALAMSVYSTDMSLKSDFYSNIHDKLSLMTSDVGLYEIRTERTSVSTTSNNHSTQVEIYDTNGCLLGEMTFN